MTKEEFGPRLRAAREATGLNQTEAADAIPMNRVSYAQYELGKRIPSVVAACNMVVRLGLDPRTVFPEFFAEEAAP